MVDKNRRKNMKTLTEVLNQNLEKFLRCSDSTIKLLQMESLHRNTPFNGCINVLTILNKRLPENRDDFKVVMELLWRSVGEKEPLYVVEWDDEEIREEFGLTD